MKRKTARGTCQKCGYRVKLRRDGTAQEHVLYYGTTVVEGQRVSVSRACSGSALPPKEQGK